MLDLLSKGDANVRPSSHSSRSGVYIVRLRLYPETQTSAFAYAEANRPVGQHALHACIMEGVAQRGFLSHGAGFPGFYVCHLAMKTLACTILSLFLSLPKASAAGSTSILPNSVALQRGVVVESVAKGLEADVAGVETGDVLLGWKTRKSRGSLGSPFDMPRLWYEEASQRPITLEGTRGGQRKAWLLGGDSWGISARPNYPEPLFSIYRQAHDLAVTGKLVEALNLFRAATIMEHRNAPWLTACFLASVGQTLATKKAWPLVDKAYEQAIYESSDLKPEVRAEIFRQWSDQFASRDDFEDATKYRQEALHEWLKLGRETVAVADTLLSISEVELRQGNFDGAEADLNRSTIIGEKIAPRGIQAVVASVNLAVLYQDRGELDKAETYYLKALYKEQMRFPRSSVLV